MIGKITKCRISRIYETGGMVKLREVRIFVISRYFRRKKVHNIFFVEFLPLEAPVLQVCGAGGGGVEVQGGAGQAGDRLQ